MKKNKISGIELFNEFWFKSCYYHALISGLSGLGISKNEVLGNNMIFAKPDFEVDESGILTEKKFEKAFGYKNTCCNIDEKTLAKRIDKGQPLIVGVDNFYLKAREDLYGIAHGVHFILVYGYDFGRGEVNIVDHEYQTDYMFKEKTMSLKELLRANKMYGKMARTKKTTCRALIGKKCGKEKNRNIFEYLSEERLRESRRNAEKNLEKLKELVEGEEAFIKNNQEKIIGYFQAMKQSYSCLSKTEFVKTDKEKTVATSRTLSGYSALLSLFWKMRAEKNFTFAMRNKESVFRKIDETKESEAKVYEFLGGFCR